MSKHTIKVHYNKGCFNNNSYTYPWKAWALSSEGDDVFISHGASKDAVRKNLTALLKQNYDTSTDSEDLEIEI